MTTAFQTAAICLTLFLSSVIQSSIGIGFAMLASAVFSFLLSPTASSALIGYAAVVLGIAVSIRMRQYINVRVSLPPMIGMIIARILGIITLMHIEEKTADMILGVILLVFSVYFWRFSMKVKICAKPWKGFVLGLLAGYLGGMYGLTGPFAAVYFYSALEDTKEYAACMNFTFVPSAFIGLIIHICYGNITADLVPNYLLSSLAVLVGMPIEIHFLNRLNHEQLAKSIYLFMAVVGFAILVI